jgi:hypothetical protein
MARPIWNGTTSFGLLNVPLQLYSGERSVDLHLRMLDSRDTKPIRYERVNSATGEEVPLKDIVKAFEYAKGNYVVMNEDDIKAAAPQATESVEIEAVVNRSSINPMFFERPYYFVQAKKSEKGYVLLREILKKTDRIGIAISCASSSMGVSARTAKKSKPCRTTMPARPSPPQTCRLHGAAQEKSCGQGQERRRARQTAPNATRQEGGQQCPQEGKQTFRYPSGIMRAK